MKATKKREEKPMPCPWCGVDPQVCSDRFGGGSVWRNAHHVRCLGLRCVISPVTIEFATKRGAINAWNRRAPAKRKK